MQCHQLTTQEPIRVQSLASKEFKSFSFFCIIQGVFLQGNVVGQVFGFLHSQCLVCLPTCAVPWFQANARPSFQPVCFYLIFYVFVLILCTLHSDMLHRWSTLRAAFVLGLNKLFHKQPLSLSACVSHCMDFPGLAREPRFWWWCKFYSSQKALLYVHAMQFGFKRVDDYVMVPIPWTIIELPVFV